jgi:hypothetical protein
MQRDPRRARFQFSDATTQRAEARLNLREALAHAERVAPPKATTPPPATTAAGSCFRKVCETLNRKVTK